MVTTFRLSKHNGRVLQILINTMHTPMLHHPVRHHISMAPIMYRNYLPIRHTQLSYGLICAPWPSKCHYICMHYYYFTRYIDQVIFCCLLFIILVMYLFVYRSPCLCRSGDSKQNLKKPIKKLRRLLEMHTRLCILSVRSF